MRLIRSLAFDLSPLAGGVGTVIGVAAQGLRFATSTAGMVSVAAVAAFGGGWHMAAQRCDAGRLRAELAVARADLRAASDAARLAQAQTASLEAEDRANQDKVNALAADLKKRPDRHCGLSRDDARRLRGID